MTAREPIVNRIPRETDSTVCFGMVDCVFFWGIMESCAWDEASGHEGEIDMTTAICGSRRLDRQTDKRERHIYPC